MIGWLENSYQNAKQNKKLQDTCAFQYHGSHQFHRQRADEFTQYCTSLFIQAVAHKLELLTRQFSIPKCDPNDAPMMSKGPAINHSAGSPKTITLAEMNETSIFIATRPVVD